MFKFILFFIVIACVAALDVKPREYYEHMFRDHMQKFKLHFESAQEFATRIEIFIQHVVNMEEHNAGNHSYKLGLNQFSHLSHEEFKQYVKSGGSKKPSLRRGNAKVHFAPKDGASLPASIDWVALGAVTPVKNQGNCGSCWSFSTTGSIEGAYFLKTGNLQSFSEQELVSCDNTNAACDGGWMDTAFEWIMQSGGLATESAYPYVSGDGTVPACDMTGISNNPMTVPSAYFDVTPGSVSALASALSQQPVSIAIEASSEAFQSYSSGVLTSTACGQDLDHGVLAVGYGTWTDGTPYWKVKNSWSSSWGMEGYVLIEKSDADLCGVLLAPSFPSL